MLSFIKASKTAWNICKLYQEGVENGNIPGFQFRNVDKNLQRESRLWISAHRSDILAPWLFVTGNFSFQNRTGCVCLNAIGNRGPVWWCFVIDMNDHLCSFSLYTPCCQPGVMHLGHVMLDGVEVEHPVEREKILYKRSISFCLLLRQTGKLESLNRQITKPMDSSITAWRDSSYSDGLHIIFWVI